MSKNTGMIESKELNQENPKHEYYAFLGCSCGNKHLLQIPYGCLNTKFEYFCEDNWLPAPNIVTTFTEKGITEPEKKFITKTRFI